MTRPDTIIITVTADNDEDGGYGVVARWRVSEYDEEVSSTGDTLYEALEHIHAAIQLALED